MTPPRTAFRTVLLAPVDGPTPSTGEPGRSVEARIRSSAGVRCGLLLTVDRTAGPVVPRPFVDEHLALDLTAPGATHWRHHADVLHLGRTGRARARERLSAVLGALPGCAVATADDADGTLFVLARSGGGLVLRTSSPVPGLVLGSLAHAWLAAGGRLAELVALAAPVTRRAARRGA
ncbi:hypothetical protein ACIPYS_04220 [Kitasatospora sp. NPDC089913]|uniref:hypothetical protein n=1 Tax=Kitasatospora sp. NPDC089913 TaxID=3364080 RepID=UPI0037F25D29